MKIFKKYNEAKKGYSKLVGFYTSPDMDNRLTLISLSNRISKSVILRQAISEWLKKSKFSDAILIGNIAEFAFHKWIVDFKETDVKASLDDFKKDLREELRLKDIAQDLIDKIMEKLDEHFRADEKTS